jgi:hypothetical protein
MGFRDGIRKPGGGILHNVVGMLRSYRVTTDTPWTQKSRGEGKELLYLELSIRPDGADIDTVQPLFLGSQEYIDVSEDEQSFTSVDRDTTSVGFETGAGKFLTSALDADFPEDRLPDLKGGEGFTLAGMVGTRFRFEQRVNEALTREKGKKDGKWNYTDLVVGEVVSLPTPTGKSNGKGAKPVSGKANKVEQIDLAEIASETLRDILADAPDNSMKVAKLKMAVFAKLGTKHPQREGVIAQLTDAAFLAEVDGVDYDAKTNSVSLA